MLRKILNPFIVLTLLWSMLACNSSSDSTVEVVEESSVLVSGFSLRDDSNVLDSLSNVFFSIDLVNAKIFNADSLPYGTDVSHLLVNISTPSSAKAVVLRYYDTVEERDSLVDYLTNSTDSIDFSGGPAYLTVTSESGSVRREYEIKVNVHQMKSDSLAWFQMESIPLPTSFTRPKSQGSALLNGYYYFLTTDGTSYCLSSTSTPDAPDWQTEEVTFGFTPVVESLRYSSDAVYMLDTDGRLMQSTDFKSWTDTGESCHYLIGGYDDQILGTKLIDGGYFITSYPSGVKMEAPADFPVENTSIPTFYDLPMSYGSQIVVAGGRCADGTLSAAAWGYDGDVWVKLSNTLLPVALEDVTLVPYDLVEMTDINWSPSSYPVILVFGGRAKNGAVNRTVYYSRDWGMTWAKAPDTIQLPDEVPPFYKATAFTYSSTMHVGSRTDGWTPIRLSPLPPTCRYLMPNAQSRAVAPITEWLCPALYLIGGFSPDGDTYTTMWRGVILEYTFVPVQ